MSPKKTFYNQDLPQYALGSDCTEQEGYTRRINELVKRLNKSEQENSDLRIENMGSRDRIKYLEKIVYGGRQNMS